LKEYDMNAIKTVVLASLLALGGTFSASASAQTMDHSAMHAGGASAPAADMTDGEIRKIDKESKKLTIRHGEIKNLQMPGMTMVFQVRDPAMLDQVKVGDKVRFKVERLSGGLVVMELQAAAN